MDNSTDSNILIIGGPNAGKTHFGGQLYGRLNSGQFKYKIDSNHRPADLTIFEDVLNKLWRGMRAEHTETSANRNLELKIEDAKGEKMIFSFPDYGGEQVNKIVNNRRINKTWKEYLDKSTSWMLFIRIDELSPIEDITNRGIPSPEEIQRRNAQPPPVKISDDAHFVELLQMLLYIKGIQTFNKIEKPNITVVLSCWDMLNLPADAIPAEILKERLPLLYEYVINTWRAKSFSIIGLSSTEKTLTDKPDEDYIDKTPIEFGYIINSEGQKERDLTLSIPEFIGNE